MQTTQPRSRSYTEQRADHDALVRAVSTEMSMTRVSGRGMHGDFSLVSLPLPWVRMPETDTHLRKKPDAVRIDEATKRLLIAEIDIKTSSHDGRRWSYSVAAALLPGWTVEVLIINRDARYPLTLDLEAARELVLECAKRQVASLIRITGEQS